MLKTCDLSFLGFCWRNTSRTEPLTIVDELTLLIVATLGTEFRGRKAELAVWGRGAVDRKRGREAG